MRITRPGPLFALAFLSAIPIQAQSASSVTAPLRDAQAMAVLQRSLAVLVGTSTVKDVTLNANANWIAGSDNESGSATLKATAIGQGRVDLALSGGQHSEVIDTSQAAVTGSWCGPDGTWHKTAAHNLFSDPTWFFPTFLINRVLASPNYAISAVDTETHDGVAVEHLKLYKAYADKTGLIQSLSQIDLYLDSSTQLPVSIAFNMHADDNALVNIPIEIKFSNYQAVQGVSVPYHIQKFIQNGLAIDVTVTDIQVNSGISAADFQAQ